MKVKTDIPGEEYDICSVFVEASRDKEKDVYFYVVGEIHGTYGCVHKRVIRTFLGRNMDAAFDLLEELRAGLEAEAAGRLAALKAKLAAVSRKEQP